LLFKSRVDLDFVLENVQGVLDGTPDWKNFQQRLLGPVAVAMLDAVTGDRVASLRYFLAATVLAANVLLFELLRRRVGDVFRVLWVVAAFALVRILLAYKLEYPWDGLNVLLFLAFGDRAVRGHPLLSLGPLLVFGTFNHEAVLYIPAWYLIAAFCDTNTRLFGRRAALDATSVLAILGISIALLRELLYVGPPSLEGAIAKPQTPIISNPLQLSHNLERLFADDWRMGGFTGVGFAAAALLFAGLCAVRAHRASALWSLCVLASVMCFGYVSETRLYLPLAAFWLARMTPPAVRT
jgi:hypothetical protein